MNDTETEASRQPRDARAESIASPDSAARLVLLLAAVAAIGIVSGHLSYVPMWDGRAYSECAVEASLRHLAPFYLRCWGHASHFSVGLLALTQLLDPGNGIGLIAVNGITLALGAVGFHRLTSAAFPDEAHRVDRALLTAVFLLQPPLLASVLQPGLDLPVLVGVVWSIALLIERRWVWSAVAGTAMVFSKETGVLLYALILACWALWSTIRRGEGAETRARKLVSAWPAAIPLGLFAAYLAFY